MEAKIIFSEQPVDDIWMHLLRYAYEDNLATSSEGHPLDPTRREEVAAAIRQAHEYFRAGASVTLNTNPVHLYYGMVSLLRATTVLVRGACPKIATHGMTLPEVLPSSSIGDLELATQGGSVCGLLVYANELVKEHGLAGGQTWSLKELLASLPDCYDDVIACYGATAEPYCIPIESLIDVSHRTIDRINLADVPNAEDLLRAVPRLRERYLPPQRTEGGYVVLRPKLGNSADISQTSLSGRKFLSLAHHKPTPVELPQILVMFMGMFILGTLSRYHPIVWTNFVANRKTSERHLIDVFCRMAIRWFPNLALNLIRKQNMVFTPTRYSATDMRSFAVADDVKEIVAREVDVALQTLLSKVQT